MKTKACILSVFFLFLFAVGAQAQATLYKGEQWLDVKGKGGVAQALKAPTIEKVEILQTDRSINVKLGTRALNYKIVSFSRFSDTQVVYNVQLNGKSYLIDITERSPGTFAITTEAEWMAYPITSVSTGALK